jgi:hypothetical protein
MSMPNDVFKLSDLARVCELLLLPITEIFTQNVVLNRYLFWVLYPESKFDKQPFSPALAPSLT